MVEAALARASEDDYAERMPKSPLINLSAYFLINFYKVIYTEWLYCM